MRHIETELDEIKETLPDGSRLGAAWTPGVPDEFTVYIELRTRIGVEGCTPVVIRQRLADGLLRAANTITPAVPTVPRAVADRLAKALEMCVANDKTEYDYRGKARRNRNGAAPDQPGERFKTPREIAADAIAEYRKAVKP